MNLLSTDLLLLLKKAHKDMGFIYYIVLKNIQKPPKTSWNATNANDTLSFTLPNK